MCIYAKTNHCLSTGRVAVGAKPPLFKADMCGPSERFAFWRYSKAERFPKAKYRTYFHDSNDATLAGACPTASPPQRPLPGALWQQANQRRDICYVTPKNITVLSLFGGFSSPLRSESNVCVWGAVLLWRGVWCGVLNLFIFFCRRWLWRLPIWCWCGPT